MEVLVVCWLATLSRFMIHDSWSTKIYKSITDRLKRGKQSLWDALHVGVLDIPPGQCIQPQSMISWISNTSLFFFSGYHASLSSICHPGCSWMLAYMDKGFLASEIDFCQLVILILTTRSELCHIISVSRMQLISYRCPMSKFGSWGTASWMWGFSKTETCLGIIVLQVCQKANPIPGQNQNHCWCWAEHFCETPVEVHEFGRKQMDFSDPHHHSETSTLSTFQKKSQRVLARPKAFPKFLEHGITSDRTIEIIEPHVKKPSMLESYLLLTWIQPCVMRLRELKQFEALNIRNLSSKLIALEISFVATQ